MRVVWFIAGIILVILAFRFIFSLLGANQSTGFGGFIYNISHPFVAPFFGLFAYHPHYGASHFEIYTLVAMAVVAIIAYGISKLVTITQA
ncbi:MAG: YggT family protein [Candidatus Saccharimonadales bacterium]